MGRWRGNLTTFSQVQVLDLAATDADLRGFQGGFASDAYGYLVPYNNYDTHDSGTESFDEAYSGKVVRIDLLEASSAPTSSPTPSPTPSPSSHTTAPTPSKLWWRVGLTATGSTIAGVVVVFIYLRRRRRLSSSRQSIAGAEGLSEPLTDDAHSDQMVSADGSGAQSSMPPVISAGTVPRDAQDVDGIRMTPVSSTVTVPRYAWDLDGISPSSLQLLLRESAAPAFMGERLSLVPKPTRSKQHTHASPSQ